MTERTHGNGPLGRVLNRGLQVILTLSVALHLTLWNVNGHLTTPRLIQLVLCPILIGYTLAREYGWIREDLDIEQQDKYRSVNQPTEGD